MESRAQWAAKLLQEFQSRVEASGIPGPHSEPSTSTAARESPAKKAQGKRLSEVESKIKPLEGWWGGGWID